MKKLLFTLLILPFLFSCGKEDDTVSVAQESYILPGNTFFPEGIAYHQKSGTFFTGSVSNGDILRVNVETGAAILFATGSQQNRAAATGLKLDQRERLWVCGGGSNTVQVLDLNGMLLKSWNTNTLFGSGFINDCVTDGTHIYFTDSQVRKIYRTSVTTATPGDLEEWLTFTDAQIPYGTGINANGIVNTPDNKYLIVVISNSGKLFRIEKASKAITEINLNTPVTAGDGLYLMGNVLYVSRNALNQIFPVTLNANYTQGTVGAGFGNNLLFNTTLDKAGDYFLVVNGQLNRRATGNPVLPFTVSRVAIP
jgi:Cu-Zn family superoxide dismutase